jgi:hypothetical protein
VVADTLSLTVRATVDDIDRKTISKCSCALRYASKAKPTDISLRAFMKGCGGINGCAALYTKRRKHGK